LAAWIAVLAARIAVLAAWIAVLAAWIAVLATAWIAVLAAWIAVLAAWIAAFLLFWIKLVFLQNNDLYSLLSLASLVPGHAGVGSLVLLGQAANLKARTGRANLSRGPSNRRFLGFLENV
jgi:hypothetical protein